MAEVTNFEHNGVSVETTESPEAMGGLGDNVVGIVGTAPNADMSVPRNSPFRINSFALAGQLDPTAAEAGSLFHTVHAILKVVKVPIYVIVVEEGATPPEPLTNGTGGWHPAPGQATAPG